MSTDRAAGSSSTSAAVVVLAVKPELLAGALGRVLRGAGWDVLDMLDSASFSTPVRALLVSPEAAQRAADVHAAVTLVLPDEMGNPGLVRRPGRPDQPLPEFRNGLRDILEILGSAT